MPEQDYIYALQKDLEQDSHKANGRRLKSIFFGGGTPSVFSENGIKQILNNTEQILGFESDIEITLEANPGTAEQNKFLGFRQAGVNRLSMGVQSFHDPSLNALGRIHGGGEAIAAFEMARKAGFQNINLDLMHGLPDQTLEMALSDLQQAIELGPEHISWYQLTIEQNTEFYRRPPVLPEDEMLWSIQEQGQALLNQAGYQQYEVSAYAKDNLQSQHNLNYWCFGDYLGIGAGAHGKWTDNNGSVFRNRKTRLPKDYLQALKGYQVEVTEVSQAELPFEFLMNVLRLKQGCDIGLFTERTGMNFGELKAIWQQLVNQGLVQPNRIATTEKGYLFLNQVLDEFL